METDNPDYYRRYVTDTNGADDERRLLSYLGTLDHCHWKDFFADVIRGHARALMMLQPDCRDELTATASVHLQRSSPATQQVAAGALQRLIDEQVSPGRHQFSVHEARALFWLASSLTTGIEVERFVSIANNGNVNEAYRAEAGRVILNHAGDASKEFWTNLKLARTPDLAPVVLLGLAKKYGAADAIRHVEQKCEEKIPRSTAMWLAFRDVLLDCVRTQGAPHLNHALRQVNSHLLWETFEELEQDYPELELRSDLPSDIVRDVCTSMSRASPRPSLFDLDLSDPKLSDTLLTTDEVFHQAGPTSREVFYGESTNHATNALLRKLHMDIEGQAADERAEFLSQVFVQMLKLKNLALPAEDNYRLRLLVTAEKWDGQKCIDLLQAAVLT